MVDDIPQWCAEVGFVDVQRQVFKLPLGKWPRNQALKEAGRFWGASIDLALEAFSVWLFDVALGRDEAETRVGTLIKFDLT